MLTFFGFECIFSKILFEDQHNIDNWVHIFQLKRNYYFGYVAFICLN